MNIILLGPPGVGKGTVAKKLSAELKLPHIATGDMLRENVANSTALGLKAKGYMDKGLLVPDDLVIEMIKERLKVYREQTAPLIDYYRKKKVLVDVDGSGTPEKVFGMVKKAINP